VSCCHYVMLCQVLETLVLFIAGQAGAGLLAGLP
jgi:hypothetical protein